MSELNGVIENTPEQASWAEKLKELLLEMNECRREAIAQGSASFTAETVYAYERRYDELIQCAYAMNPLPDPVPGKKGPPKRGKRLALIDRLSEHRGEVCLFIRDFSVPFTNNLAEQSVRMMKVKTKVSGCFRTESGAEDFVKIMSYLHSAMKHGLNAFQAIFNGLLGNSRLGILNG